MPSRSRNSSVDGSGEETEMREIKRESSTEKNGKDESPAKSRSRSVSNARSTSKGRAKSGSRSTSRKRSTSKKRSASKSRSRSRSRGRNTSRSPRRRSRSRNRSRSKGSRRSRSRSRSRSPRPRNKDDGDGFRLHVADIDEGVRKKDLERVFMKYGPLKEIWLASYAPFYAFVVYRNRFDAQEACEMSDGTDINGRRIRVSQARPRQSGPRPKFDGGGGGGGGRDRFRGSSHNDRGYDRGYDRRSRTNPDVAFGLVWT